MTREEKARWLSDFYARVAEGEEMLFAGNIVLDGPYMDNTPGEWTTRKPKRGVWVLFGAGSRIVDAYHEKPKDSAGWVYMEEADAPTT